MLVAPGPEENPDVSATLLQSGPLATVVAVELDDVVTLPQGQNQIGQYGQHPVWQGGVC